MTYPQPALRSLIIAIISTFLATLAVGLRLLARRLKRVELGSDDFMIVAGLIFTYPVMILLILGVVHGGSGLHAQQLGVDRTMYLMKIVAIFGFAWAFALLFVKFSILLFYRRIFATPKFRLATNIMGGLVFCWFLIVTFELAFVCRPFAFNWDQSIVGGKCGPQIRLWLSNGILHVIIDTMILILPMPMVWNLNTRLLNKVSLSAIFGLGFFIPIVGCLRLTSLIRVNFKDPSFTVPDAFLWSMLEPPFAIICASLPIIRPLAAKLVPAFFTKWSVSGSNRRFPKPARENIDSGSHQNNFQRLDERSYPLGAAKVRTFGDDSIMRDSHEVDRPPKNGTPSTKGSPAEITINENQYINDW